MIFVMLQIYVLICHCYRTNKIQASHLFLYMFQVTIRPVYKGHKEETIYRVYSLKHNLLIESTDPIIATGRAVHLVVLIPTSLHTASVSAQ